MQQNWQKVHVYCRMWVLLECVGDKTNVKNIYTFTWTFCVCLYVEHQCLQSEQSHSFHNVAEEETQWQHDRPQWEVRVWCHESHYDKINGWEATHAMADHGVIDSELCSIHSCMSEGVFVCLPTIIVGVYLSHLSASLNHPCCSSRRTESHEEEPLIFFFVRFMQCLSLGRWVWWVAEA